MIIRKLPMIIGKLPLPAGSFAPEPSTTLIFAVVCVLAGFGLICCKLYAEVCAVPHYSALFFRNSSAIVVCNMWLDVRCDYDGSRKPYA